MDKVTRRRRPPEERFWPKVNKNGPVPVHRPELGPCWVWTAGKMSAGYGNFTMDSGDHGVGRRLIGAHRFAYETTGRTIPDGLDLDHLCHPGDGSCAGGITCPHRLCVNPDHLEPATRRENVRRGVSLFAANMAATHCPQGHEYTPENTRIRIGRTGYENRSCKECGRREPTGKINPLIAANAAKTHCPKGHEYAPENTIIDLTVGGKKGGRRCRMCRNEQQRRSYQKRHGSAA